MLYDGGMRSLAIVLVLAACGGGTDPRLIPGGGIGDGDIDGTVFVHVIDDSTDQPLANASVAIGSQEKLTDAKGFVEFGDVDGPQTIAVKLQGYRPTVWARANGKNVTVPLDKSTSSIQQATLSGSITGWGTVTVAAQHIKAALVFYSQTDDLGDDSNSIDTPNMGNICLGQQDTCNWTLASRAGTVTLVAAIVDRDTKGTLTNPDDDTQQIVGWATKTGLTVENGVNQTGLALTLVEAGNLENLTIDYGAPPAALTTKGAFIGIEISDNEVVQLPMFDQMSTTLLAPKASVFGSTSGLRLTAVAQTTSGDLGAQSIVLRRNLSPPTLAAGEWLTPPVGVTATRTGASWELVTGAKLHQVQYQDAIGNSLLEITVFDDKATSVDVPPLVALPTSGAITARVSGIGANLDLQDFSLEEDEDKLFAVAAQPVQLP